MSTCLLHELHWALQCACCQATLFNAFQSLEGAESYLKPHSVTEMLTCAMRILQLFSYNVVSARLLLQRWLLLLS